MTWNRQAAMVLGLRVCVHLSVLGISDVIERLRLDPPGRTRPTGSAAFTAPFIGVVAVPCVEILFARASARVSRGPRSANGARVRGILTPHRQATGCQREFPPVPA